MDEQQVRAAADGLSDTLRLIESGDVEASAQQRAYLAGAEHALRVALGDVEEDDSPRVS